MPFLRKIVEISGTKLGGFDRYLFGSWVGLAGWVVGHWLAGDHSDKSLLAQEFAKLAEFERLEARQAAMASLEFS